MTRGAYLKLPKGRPLPRRLRCTPPNYISPSVRKAAPVLHPFFRCSQRNSGRNAVTVAQAPPPHVSSPTRT
nr:MAG TPA: hypothetical protein [Caudoviricetes sp.]